LNGTIYQPLAVTDISGKQNTLVSGTNIKTINGNSVLGSGDIAISAGGSTVNTAFTQKTFAASMSVAHDPANPNFFVNITGDFSLSNGNC
jgi:lipopolysaccharide export system protein LptA